MKPRSTIDQLIERSSLGAPEARIARASVSRTLARRLVAAAAPQPKKNLRRGEG
jgi:hypothetical protein